MNEDKKQERKARIGKALTWLKYIFVAAVILFGSLGGSEPLFCALAGLLELLVIIGASELLLVKHKVIGRIVNMLAVLIIVVQFAVMHFGGTYVSMIMMTNIHAISALKGKAALYISAGVFALVISFIPVVKIINNRKVILSGIPVLLAADVFVCSVGGAGVSPFYSLGSLNYTAMQRQRLKRRIANALDETTDEDTTISVHNTENTDRPDVVLIFTEGLSQNIIDDPRNIMPNVKKYEQESINFLNYFNHTEATYRGIGSQLHSGFQLEDMDNNGLLSLQDVFSSYGYETTLINPEPDKEDFNEHLSKFGFDKYISDASLAENDGNETYIYDKNMYDLAWSLLDQPHDQPQLIVFYTFGTHVALFSPNERFGDGNNSFLNKFYNLDYQFGSLMDRIENSDHADHTMVVFTTDHATYQDDDFRNTFSGEYQYDRAHNFCDRIPLLIWRQGITPDQIDVNGRTSLDMAPTVLDYLDMEIPSCFLGSSLFESSFGQQRLIETTFAFPVGDEYLCTDGAYVHEFSDEDRSYVKNRIEEYCIKAQAAALRKGE